MADNHRSVIGEITHGRYQCREAGELARASSENENGTKLHAQFIFDACTRAQLKRIASQGLLGNVSHQGVCGER
jgi:hypothetical protein